MLYRPPAHRVLLGSDPGTTTVSRVAADVGFYHLGRFAHDYRKAFHETPTETLRR